MEKLRLLLFVSLLAVGFLLPGFADAQPAAEQDSITTTALLLRKQGFDTSGVF